MFAETLGASRWKEVLVDFYELLLRQMSLWTVLLKLLLYFAMLNVFSSSPRLISWIRELYSAFVSSWLSLSLSELKVQRFSYRGYDLLCSSL